MILRKILLISAFVSITLCGCGNEKERLSVNDIYVKQPRSKYFKYDDNDHQHIASDAILITAFNDYQCTYTDVIYDKETGEYICTIKFKQIIPNKE